MSRIFDALRRSEQERASRTSAAKPAGANLQDIVASLDQPGFVPDRPAEARPGRETQQPPSPSQRGVAPPAEVPSPPETGGWSLDRVETCHVRTQEPVVAQIHHHIGAEKFRVLCHSLRQLRQRRSVRSVLVTSAIPKEGKTVVALNLAITLAQSAPRVLLVDTDLRRSGLHETLLLPSGPGLKQVLEGQCELGDAVRKIQPFGLYCLPAGTSSASPVELLQSPRMRELAAQLTGEFDWVIFDSPPLNPFADARCVASLADAVLVVVRSGWTPRDGVQQGLAALNGTYIAGVVLNGTTDSPHDHYYYYYYASPGARAKRAADLPSVPAGELVASQGSGHGPGIEA